LFDELMFLVAGRFGRAEPRRTAREFVLGLLSPVERKNCWWLAKRAGHGDPQAMQRLLRTAVWDADVVRDDLRGFVAAQLGHVSGVLIPDETGFLKKGTGSVGVQRQYSGTAGRIENCQVGVFVSYASARGRALIDRRVYLPRSWTDDPQRCAAAGVPAGVRFATKPELALEMITKAVAAQMPASWVAADEVYGDNGAFRAGIAALGLGYVLAVSRDHRIQAFPGGKRWLRAEENFQASKGLAGLDHYQVRTWTGWHRFITLAMLALAFLMACAPAPAPPADPWHHARHGTPIALTAAEIRRLFNGLVTGPFQGRLATPLRVTGDIKHWSSWRRHHQGQARRSHYQRRHTAEFDP
jgi:SRSO17 transposase